MTLEQRIAVLEEIFAKLQDYYTSAYSGEEIDARLASAGVPVGITKEYKSVTEMNQDFTGTDVQRGQFVLILPDSTSSADYGKVYIKGTANWVYAFTLTTLTSIKGPIGPPGKKGDQGDPGEAGSSFAILGYFDTLDALKAAVPNPKAGDVYGVGTAPPYNIYIWDSVHGKWVANGNLQGPQGKQGIQGPEGKQGPDGKQGPEGPVGGSSNFVRYDAAQDLTDEQKAQAQTNIGVDAISTKNIGSVSKSLNASELQAYLDSLPRLLTENHVITLNGTHSQIVYIKDFYGCGSIILRAANLGDCVFTKNIEITNCHVPVNMEKLKWELNAESPSTNACIICSGSTVKAQECSVTGYVSSSGEKIGRGVTTLEQGSVTLLSCAFHNLDIVLNTFQSGFIGIAGGKETDYSGNNIGVYTYWGGLVMLSDDMPLKIGGSYNTRNTGGAIIQGNAFVR